MLFKALVLFNSIGATWLAYQTFQAYPDHSPEAVFRWVGFYAIAIVGPMCWSIYYLRKYRSVFDANQELRRLALMPVMVGCVTLLIALNLISGR
jgi:cytochrome bd-type quinol oxidase subunit 2